MKNSVEGLICLVVIQSLSFFCSVYLLFTCLKKKSTIWNLPNHVILCLLIVSTWLISIDLVSTQVYYWNEYVPIQTDWACRFYNVSFFTTSNLNRMFMAFMSIERHFLVFRPQLYHTRRFRYLLHYFPLIFLIGWSLIYSIATDIFLTCPQIRFRYNRFLCGYTCSVFVRSTVMIYVWIQVFLPTMITTLACILLPIRFLLKKSKLQRLQWRRARRMIVQMSTIAATYTFCWLPYAILLQLISVNYSLLNDYHISRYMIFDAYVPSLLTPFICFHTIVGKWKWHFRQRILRYCFSQRQTLIHPHNHNNIAHSILPFHLKSN